MRPLYVDISGTTDANGNASIPVALARMTGRWHNAKFTVGTSGAAEWAVLVNGRPYTFGRGRRVTLGPELIQDGQTATISVIGGPVKAVIDGTATGVSGTPDEILATYVPAPNTIALDTASPSVVLGSVSAGVGTTVTQDFPLPPGTQAIGFIPDGTGANQPASQVKVTGDQSGALIYDTGSGGHYPAGPIPMPMEPIDTSVTVSVKAPASAGPSKVYFYVITAPSQIVVANGQQNPVAISAAFSLPAIWQAPNLRPISFGGALTGGQANAQLIRAGVANQTIYLFGFNLSVATGLSNSVFLSDGDPNAGGTNIWSGTLVAQGNLVSLNWGGAPLTVGNGLFVWVDANATIRGGVSISQG